MPEQGIVNLSTSDLLVIVSVGLIFGAFALWRLFYVNSDRRDMGDTLTDGAVLLVADGMVQQLSPSARELLGPCENTPVIRVLDEFLGVDATEARDAVNRLEMTGDAVDMLVHSSDGRAFELIGSPSGALIRLILRDADFMDLKLRDAEERVNAASLSLQQRRWEHDTMSALIAEAPLIAWHRTAQGQINWSGGEILVRNSRVLADRAVDLIVARTKLNRQPVLAGQPQKSRIEIVVDDQSETMSLHVVEIIRPDGSRIGFATDAGTAASAERTLTRFVQTMTETFAHLTVGLAIFDRNQTLALFNPALVQMWQVEPAWLARRPSLRDIIDELRATRRLPELQDFHKWRSKLLNLFENTEAADYEELWHLADGSNIRVLARPHPHGSLAFIFDDVTERVRLEQRYRHSIDLRRATLDRLTEGIAVFGPNGLLQFVNQAFHEIWGTDSETVYAAMHARQLVSLCEDLTVTDTVWQDLHSFITGQQSRRAWDARLEMGSGRWLLVRVAPLPDGSTMAVFGDLGSDVGHPEPQVSGLLSANSQEGTALHVDEPDLSGPQDGRVDLGPEISSFLERTADRLMRRPSMDGIPVKVGDCTGPDSFTCDPVRLRQVAFILAAEAARHTSDGTEVTLSTFAGTRPGCLTLSVVATNADSQPDFDDQTVQIATRFAEQDGGAIQISLDPTERALVLACAYDSSTAQNSDDGGINLEDWRSRKMR